MSSLCTIRGATVLVLWAGSCAANGETLEQAWRTALVTDARLAAAESRMSAGDAELAAARAERYPSVTASTVTSRWRDTPAFDFSSAGLAAAVPLFGGRTLKMAAAELSLSLYSGGALGANVDAAAAARDGQSRGVDALRQDIKLAVADAYVGVLRAASALEVSRSNSASLAAHARDVEDMRRTGQVPTNDYLAAAVSLADARQRELQAQGALEVAHAVYNRRTGRPLDTPVILEPLDGAFGSRTSGAPLAELVATARTGRPEIAELDAAAQALASRAAAARAARRPQVALSGGYAHLENEFLSRQDFWFVSLGVRVNVLDAGRHRHAASSLDQQSNAVRNERRDRAAAVELEVHRTWRELATARARVDVAASAVEQAEENLRVVRDRYRNGEGTNTEVLDAEALRALSDSNFDNARYDARLAELSLARAVGTL
jgi:outer membrane protein TolC